MLRSVALMLEHGLGRPEEARRLDAAVDEALASAPTPDLGGSATTAEVTAAVLGGAPALTDRAIAPTLFEPMQRARETRTTLFSRESRRARLYALAGASFRPRRLAHLQAESRHSRSRPERAVTCTPIRQSSAPPRRRPASPRGPLSATARSPSRSSEPSAAARPCASARGANCRSPSAGAAGERGRTHRRLRRPRRRPRGDGLRPALPGVGTRPAAELHGGRGGDGRRARSSSASSRSRARSPGRSPRRTTCSRRRRCRSRARRCSGSATACSASRTCRWSRSASSARTRPRSTSAAGCSPRCRGRPRSPPGRRPRRPRTSPSAATPRRRRSRASVRPTLYGLTVISGDVGDHPEAYTRFVSVATYTRLDRVGRGLADGVRVRHRPPAGRARTARSSRSPATGSTSFSSSRARSRTRRGATASTPSSPATRSTRRSGGRSRRSRRQTRRLKVFGSYPARRA